MDENEIPPGNYEESVYCSGLDLGCDIGYYGTCRKCQRQVNVSGRLSIRDPDFDLKPLGRAYIQKHGTDEWVDLGTVENFDITYDYTEAEHALVTAFWDTHYGQASLPGDPDRTDEVS